MDNSVVLLLLLLLPIVSDSLQDSACCVSRCRGCQGQLQWVEHGPLFGCTLDSSCLAPAWNPTNAQSAPPADWPLHVQVQEVCLLVTQRSARLVAAAIAALLRHSGRGCQDDASSQGEVQHTVIAVDGSVFSKFPKFR